MDNRECIIKHRGFTNVLSVVLTNAYNLGTRFANLLSTLVEEQLNSLEPVAGYNKLHSYLKDMRRNKPVTVQLCLEDELLSTG